MNEELIVTSVGRKSMTLSNGSNSVTIAILPEDFERIMELFE